jgi:hypothetical protein
MPVSKRRNGRDAHIAELRSKGAVMLGGQPHRVRNEVGKVFPCVYGDCWKDGDTKWRIERRNPDAESPHEPGGKIIEIFCSERHRDLRIQEKQEIHRRGPLGNRR